MTCPNCKIELECPCGNCQKWRKKTGKIAALTEEWLGNEEIRCPICGFTARMDFWEDYDFYEYDKDRGELSPGQEKFILSRIEKWRDENEI